MLTAEHVRYRKKGKEIIVRHLDARERPRAVEIAAAYLEVARSCIGQSRDAVDEALGAVPIGVREKRLGDGLRKLIEDASEFSAQAPVEPQELRSDVFLAASAARKAADDTARFERQTVLTAVAGRHSLDVEGLERALYADLKGEQVLLSLEPLRPEILVDRYDRGQTQAVLLRAVKVMADVKCRGVEGYRALFRELKFRRLLYRIERRDDGGYRLEIDGPFSLFESVTKYGLQLALVLPALDACDSLTLVAEVRWGKQREPLLFRYEGGRGAREATTELDGSALRDDVGELVAAFGELGTAWRARENSDILDLPGIGLCIPDLVFEKRGTKHRIYFEALGFWSRDAVWKRVELVQQGLSKPILFAASSRLRVSEAVLDDAHTAALYVYKGVMSARAVARKLDELVAK